MRRLAALLAFSLSVPAAALAQAANVEVDQSGGSQHVKVNGLDVQVNQQGGATGVKVENEGDEPQEPKEEPRAEEKSVEVQTNGGGATQAVKVKKTHGKTSKRKAKKQLKVNVSN